MEWEKKIGIYCDLEEWELAINLMQDVIKKHPDDIDAYLNILYIIVIVLVEYDYGLLKNGYYTGLLRKYFIESYSKFLSKPEYLFYVGRIACIAEWYFNIEIEEAQQMMKDAANIEPDNFIYKWAYYSDLDTRIPSNKKEIVSYAQQALSNIEVKKVLESKGVLGKYLLDSLKFWSVEIISIDKL